MLPTLEAIPAERIRHMQRAIAARAHALVWGLGGAGLGPGRADVVESLLRFLATEAKPREGEEMLDCDDAEESRCRDELFYS